MTLIIRNHDNRQRNKNKHKMEYFIFASLKYSIIKLIICNKTYLGASSS